MRKLRLMNVGQVLYSQSGLNLDIRPYCVEITSDRSQTMLVMWSLYDRNSNPNQSVEPRLVCRFQLSDPAIIHDSIDVNGSDWIVQAGDRCFVIRPHDGEYIWIDRSFSMADAMNVVENPSDPQVRQLRESLRDMYNQRRACMHALIVHERFLRSTPPEQATVKHMHMLNIQTTKDAIERLEARISDKEAELKRRL